LVLILAAEWDPRDELWRCGTDHAVLGEDWAHTSELVWTPEPFGGTLTLGGRRVQLA
jgi:hypothetical protein